jgi:O-antigen/teichoic acid export membrane protein
MTRYYAPDVYGSIAWTLSFVNTFNAVADLGFNAAHIKRVSEGKDIHDCLSTFLVVKTILTSIMILTIIASVLLWSSFSGERFSQSTLELIMLFILYSVFYDLASIATTTFDGRVETAKTQVSVIMDPLVRIPLIAIISISRLDATYIAYAYVLGGLTVAITSLAILMRGQYRFVKPTLFKSYVKFAFPIALISIMGAISANADKLLIGLFWSDAHVGFYSASQSTLGLFSVIGVAVSTITFPTFSRMHKAGNLIEVRKKTKMAERYISMIAIPIVVVVFLFPSEIALILFAENFVQASGPLRFLSLSMLLGLLNGVYASQINAVDRPDITAKLTLVSLSVNLLMLLILVPPSINGITMLGLGATGAAIANVVTVGTVFVVTRLVVKRLTNTRSNPRILLHIVAGIITGCILYFVNFIWPLMRWYDLVGYGIVSFGIFVTILFLLREFTRDDINYFLSVVSPSGMKEYLNSELRRKNR